MTLDPNTIAMILAILIPIVQKCLEDRMTPEEAMTALVAPNLRQRIVLMISLPRKQRRELRAWRKWNAEHDDVAENYGMDDETAEEIVEEAVALNLAKAA